MDKISIIIPCLNEQEAIPVYYRAMVKVMDQMRGIAFELLYVDDGSNDGTLEILRNISTMDRRCRYLSFSRNFGKEAAIYAGLSNVSGNLIVVMDVDLQDPPELILQMYQIMCREDVDCVAARRSDRKGEPGIRSLLSRGFYRCINKIAHTQIVSGARDFRMMSRQMADAVLSLSEYNRFSKGIFQWVGFRTKWLEYPNVERCAGETKWSLRKLTGYAVEGIVGMTTEPLRWSLKAGMLLCAAGTVMAVVSGIDFMTGNNRMMGLLLILCVILLVGGLQLISMGIIGEYLSKTYLEVKNRPVFIIKESSDSVCGKVCRHSKEKAA